MPKAKIRIMSILLVLIFIISGCGGSSAPSSSFDHAAYVKALLDACYKAEFEEYTKLTGSTSEEALAQYRRNLDTIVNDMGSAISVDVSDENRQRIAGAMEKFFKSASYDVAEAEKSGDGIYSVEIKIRPVTNFSALWGELNAFADDFIIRINSSEFEDMSSDEIRRIYLDELTALFEKASQTIFYGDETTISVPVEHDDELEKWFVPNQAQDNIFKQIIAL